MQTRAEMLAERKVLVSHGSYASWYLRPSQLDIYDLILRDRNPFIEASRRFGKSTSIITFVLEMLNANPGWICRWCTPWKFQARQIVKPIIGKLQELTPEEQKFRWTTEDSVYRHATNGSLFYLVGVNDDGGESARGPAANIIVADEYGSWKDASYILTDILRPQLQEQEGRWMIRASTPPPDLDHVYYEDREIAIRKDRYIKKVIWDKETLSHEELQEIIDETGGVESESFQREYLCEDVVEAEMQVVPDYSDIENVVPDAFPRPQFFTPYVAGDSGADDNTALLFGYYDFPSDTDVVEAEIITNGLTTGTIVLLAKVMELFLWNALPLEDFERLNEGVRAGGPELRKIREEIKEYHSAMRVKPHGRVYDAPKQLIYDIFTEYDWAVTMPNKSDKNAAVHLLRSRINARRFLIKESCTGLRRQLKVGRWKDEKKTDFQRSENLGHLDAIAAAIYFNRHVDRTRNPMPANHGLHRETHFLPPRSSVPRDQSAQAIARLLKPKARFR